MTKRGLSESTAYELVTDVRSIDPKFGGALHSLVFDDDYGIPALKTAALNAARLWLKQGSSGLILPVHGTSNDSRHIEWVDWVDETRDVVARQIQQAP